MGAGQGRNRTGIILLLIVLVVLVGGGIAAVVLLGVVGGNNGDPSAEGTIPPQGELTATPTATATPPVVNVIVAARDIPRGARLTLDDVTVINYPDDPANPLPPSLLTVEDGPDQGIEQIEGRVARTDLISGQPVHEFMITPGDEPTDLSSVGGDAALKIPSGFVAMTVPMTRLSMVDYLVREGDHVDVLASYRFVDVDEEFQTAYPNNSIFVSKSQPPANTLQEFEVLNDVVEVLVPGSGSYVSFPFGSADTGPRDEAYINSFPGNRAAYPSHLVVSPGEAAQRPRQTTQLIIDNAVVLQVGLDDYSEIYVPFVYEPIVVTAVPTAQPTAVPQEGGEAGAEGQQPAPQPQQPPADNTGEQTEPTAVPTATAIPAPLTITLVMSRQDALVMKYSMEIGADLDLVLRSVLDDNITDISTDSVTLEYILDVYGVEVPDRLNVATSPRIDLLPFGDIFTFDQVEDNPNFDVDFNSGPIESGQDQENGGGGEEDGG